MKEKVIAIFDIGESSKRILLFNYDLKIVSESEEKFFLIKDEDGFECEDIGLIERWVRKTGDELARSDKYDLTAVNFVTYGAALVFLDAHGKRLSPLYNYNKPIAKHISENLYLKYGGAAEFCRKTATQAMGMINAGLQIIWLKTEKPDIFSKVRSILHYPQYLSYLFTGKECSERTSIGCHTALWDFDKMDYHTWVREEGIPVQKPVAVETINKVLIGHNKINIGIGINYISAILSVYLEAVPYPFILVSTGKCCTSMNPFNPEPLSPVQLSRDCFCYITSKGQPVKASKMLLGHMHDIAIGKIGSYFKIHSDSFILIKPDLRLLNKLSTRFKSGKIFIDETGPVPELKEDADLFAFDNFIEAYHQLMIELSDLVIDSINLIISGNDTIGTIFVTGTFTKTLLFLKMLASSFPDKKVFVSEVSNARAIGAASVILNSPDPHNHPLYDLFLTEVEI